MACLCGSPKVILNGQCKWCYVNDLYVENECLMYHNEVIDLENDTIKQILFDTTYKTQFLSRIYLHFCDHHRYNICKKCKIFIDSDLNLNLT